jgi:hypothetical protein
MVAAVTHFYGAAFDESDFAREVFPEERLLDEKVEMLVKCVLQNSPVRDQVFVIPAMAYTQLKYVLPEALDRGREGREFVALVINIRGNHWVTLLGHVPSGSYLMVTSLRSGVGAYAHFLTCLLSKLGYRVMDQVEANRYKVEAVPLDVQEDDFSCALWAVEFLRVWLDNSLDFDAIIPEKFIGKTSESLRIYYNRLLKTL